LTLKRSEQEAPAFRLDLFLLLLLLFLFFVVILERSEGSLYFVVALAIACS
jgi:hypothetical protein